MNSSHNISGDTDKLTMHQGASNLIFKNAEVLRRNMTRTESIMWEKLRKNQLGIKFRRQHPIGMYIVDFYCHSIKLIIEIDGDYHLNSNQIELDQIREENLKSSGLKILRFRDEEILNTIDTVLERIKLEIGEILNEKGDE